MAAQQDDPDSLLHFCHHLIGLRRTEAALAADASYETVYAAPEKYPYIYRRRAGGEEILVVLNPADRQEDAPLTAADSTGWKLLAGEAPVFSGSGLSCGPRSFAILKR